MDTSVAPANAPTRYGAAAIFDSSESFWERGQAMKHEQFSAIYDRRERASFEDATAEADTLVKAVERIRSSAKGGGSAEDLAAGKLFEIAGEFASAEIAYRRAAADPAAIEAAVRHVVVLIKQKRYPEAIDAANALFLKAPDTVVKSLIYEGPLALSAVLGDAHRLSGDVATAAGFYREAARLDGGTPYAVGQAAITLAASGETAELSTFVGKHSGAAIGRVQVIARLGGESDARLALVKQLARRLASVGAAEAMWVSPLDLVSRP